MATVYVAPLSLLLHLGLASYFYTVVVECPDEIICDPSPELTVTYALMASAAGILLLVSVLLSTASPELMRTLPTHTRALTGARAHTHTLTLSHTHTHTQVWHPLLYREPTDEYQQIRSKEVPFAYVEGIERYEPPHDFQEDSWEGAGATDSQIGISVF